MQAVLHRTVFLNALSGHREWPDRNGRRKGNFPYFLQNALLFLHMSRMVFFIHCKKYFHPSFLEDCGKSVDKMWMNMQFWTIFCCTLFFKNLWKKKNIFLILLLWTSCKISHLKESFISGTVIANWKHWRSIVDNLVFHFDFLFWNLLKVLLRYHIYIPQKEEIFYGREDCSKKCRNA